LRAIYIAHPLGQGADREHNRLNAMLWCASLAEGFGIAPIADWIVLSGVWDESRRDLGMAIDMALIRRCDELWLCGGRISPGMAIEKAHAEELGKKVRDLTWYGHAPPPPTCAMLQSDQPTWAGWKWNES
jgi:hypothetical protein